MNGRLRRRLRPPFATLPLATLPFATLPACGGGLRRRPAAASRVDGFIAIRSNLYSLLLRPRVGGVERPLLCLIADAPHGDRKRPRRNAHFIGASSAHASNYQGSARGSVHLGDDVTHEAAACGRSPRCLLAAARGVEQPKKTFARIQPSLVSCEAVSRQRR